MNAPEGLTRIATVIRWLGYLLAAYVIVAGVVTFPDHEYSLTYLAVALLGGAAIGGIGWVIGWVVDGFAKPKS